MILVKLIIVFGESKHSLSKIAIASSAIAVSALAIAPVQAATFTPINFSSSANFQLQSLDAGYPAGNVTLGGVPFNIQTSGNNTWHSEVATGPNPRVLNIPVGVFGVTEVNTLINNYWGQAGPTSYASLEFFGSGGAYYKKDLVGNVDIRDFLNNVFTNSINGTTTTQVYSGFGTNGFQENRLDKQQITLPSIFQTNTLNSIRLSDNGGNGFQRTFLAGVTVAVEPVSVPEPSSILGLLGLGVLGIGTALKRKV